MDKPYSIYVCFSRIQSYATFDEAMVDYLAMIGRNGINMRNDGASDDASNGLTEEERVTINEAHNVELTKRRRER